MLVLIILNSVPENIQAIITLNVTLKNIDKIVLDINQNSI